MTTQIDIRPAAIAYAQSGLSVIPCYPASHPDPKKKKTPIGAWKQYQDTIAAEGIIRTWKASAIAVIGGAVSGGLVTIDFDAPELFTPWGALVESQSPRLVPHLIHGMTPRGGHHLRLRCSRETPRPAGPQMGQRRGRAIRSRRKQPTTGQNVDRNQGAGRLCLSTSVRRIRDDRGRSAAYPNYHARRA